MYDDTDPIERRRAKRRQAEARRLYLILGVLVLAVATVGAVGVVAWRQKQAGVSDPGKVAGDPAPGRASGDAPDDWTHTELASHLKGRGVPLRLEGAGPPNASLLVDDATGKKVHVDLVADGKTAREQAAAHGSGSFAWGRFVFYRRSAGEADLLARVRTAIP